MAYPMYKINNTLLWLEPESGKWVSRSELAFDGCGHPVYPAPREFELSWGLMDASGMYQLQQFFELLGNSGTCSVDLPRYAVTPFQFWTFSGCTLSEPTFDSYFEETYTGVKLLIHRIRG